MTTDNSTRSPAQHLALSALSFMAIGYAIFFVMDLFVGDADSARSQLFLIPFLLATSFAISKRRTGHAWKDIMQVVGFLTFLVTGCAFIYQLAMDTVSPAYLALYPGTALLLLVLQSGFDMIFYTPSSGQGGVVKQSWGYRAIGVMVAIALIVFGVGSFVYAQFFLS